MDVCVDVIPSVQVRYSTKCYTEVQPLHLLYTAFPRKGTPFVYLSLTNGTHFTYLQ